ncbi:MAG TPA: ribbon-helix-helix domain-containing protein [Stellaceae bacterium]|jgi:predicted DNA-binding ribbon-helix-helix protein
MAARSLRKRSVTIAGHATSFSLEEEFWQALQTVARQRNLSLNALVGSIDAARTGNLSSALRVFVLECYRSGELLPAAENR